MGCFGPDSTRWDGEACISTAQQTSCDEANATTCYYADVQIEQGQSRAREYFGGQFVDKSECGDFRVDIPGPLASLGVKAGDVIYKLNGRTPTAKSILFFTASDPAKRAEVTRNSGDSRIKLSLYYR